MNKKIIILPMLIVGAIFLSGCANNNQAEKNNNAESVASAPATEDNLDGACEKENVSIEGYGEPGKRLKNCFVEYPGEPSRQDKSYYIVEDICGQFTKEFVENALGQKVVKIELPKYASLYNCSYYLNDKEYLLFNLEYLKIENQKLFYQQTGDKVEKNPKIPMDNVVITQGDLVSEIYFVLSPEKFISIKPSSKNTIENGKFIDFAIKIGEAIKNYK
ncbi:MAG TPA: hypothetical protein PLB52_00320 [Candidatus Moranbacteria bacterium]|nr:hypothetical protein [Candidatus Moranbacteria bacterium]